MNNKTKITANLRSIRLFLRWGQWEFSPGLMPSVAIILLLPLLISLGFWQMHRADAKQQLLDQFALRSYQAPQPLVGNEPMYTPVQAIGHYDNAHLILLDNRIINHQAGYDVLIPFIPAGSQSAVLVNLGWIPRTACYSLAAGRAQNCKLNVASFTRDNPVAVTGLVHIPEHNLVLAHPKTQLNWPLVVEDIRITELSRTLDRPLYSFILLATDVGFVHHWGLITSVTPARHRAYAVQWFALAVTLIVLYFWLSLRRK